MAEWFTARYKHGGMVSTFTAIGHPFAFAAVSSPIDGARVYRSFVRYPWEESDDAYELRFLKVGEDGEVDEEGWYLSGVGHHLLWCGKAIEEAVDTAQEHIAWDGSDPTALPLLPVGETRPHAYPVPDHVWQADEFWMAFFGKETDGGQ